MMKKTLLLKDLGCANCAAKIETQTKNISGVNSAAVDFVSKKLTIEIADEISLQLGHNYIGTEHILLSLMKEVDSIAVRILIDANVDPQKIFAELLSLLTEESPINNFSFSFSLFEDNIFIEFSPLESVLSKLPIPNLSTNNLGPILSALT